MQKNRIELSSKFKNLLKDEFNTSLTSVQAALDFKVNSEQATNIRKRAQELLLGEAAKVELPTIPDSSVNTLNNSNLNN